jgi:hypothetical protein
MKLEKSKWVDIFKHLKKNLNKKISPKNGFEG